MEVIEMIMEYITKGAILFFEFVGVLIILATGIHSVIMYIRRDPSTTLRLAKGLSAGLQFKLGSEILRTVLVRDLSELVLIGAIVVLRAALTFLIRWEIKSEESGQVSSEKLDSHKRDDD